MTSDFNIGYLKEKGFQRQVCRACGAHFWSLGEHDVCGEVPCADYDFISQRTFKVDIDIHAMRTKYLRFFEKRGHKVIGRYPIVARWRDDTFFTNATIYAFQPWVTSGVVDPPANPLVISQTCVRFNDIDNVGVTGRHLTMFEMMAHHAFNRKGKAIYFKDRTVELCHDLLTKEMGTDPEIIKYKEEWWEGGGNSGPSLSVGIRGIELATLVFMQYSGAERKPMDMTVVDTGYGLERFTWVSGCAPNVYEAAFPDVIGRIRTASGVKMPDLNVLKTYSKVAGMMDLESKADARELKQRAASRIKMDIKELDKLLTPLEMIYSIADHMRASTFLINDGVLPSNVKAGYFLRLLIRRTMRCIEVLGCELKPADIARWHVESLGHAFPDLKVNIDSIVMIIGNETKKYHETVKRGSQIIAETVKKKGIVELDDLIKLYDSHGLTPDTVQRITGSEVKVPDDFFAKVAALHETVEKEQLREVPESNAETDLLCYDLMKELKGERKERFLFDANVIKIIPLSPEKQAKLPSKGTGLWLVLDKTYFYPEGGGQESDRGTITIKIGERVLTLSVMDVQRSGKAVLHLVQHEGVGALVAHYSSKKRMPVRCDIDVKRRLSLMRHHTATHIVNGAAREILGRHVWQTGAHKSSEFARLDITHFEQIDDETMTRIEARANEIVMDDRPVSKSVEERSEAEHENGFAIYQGGFIPGKELRIVDIPGFDVEACGGTHCDRTGEVGLIKMTGSKRIQDGIVRLEFVAGERALRKIGEKETLIKKIAMAVNAPEASLLVAVRTMVEERRHLEKRLFDASRKEAEDIFSKMIEGVHVSGETMIIFSTNEHEPEIVEEISRIVSGKQGILSVLNPKGVTKVYVARGRGVPLSAREILRGVCEVAGGGGGGTDDFARGEVRETARLKEAVEKALKVSFG